MSPKFVAAYANLTSILKAVLNLNLGLVGLCLCLTAAQCQTLDQPATEPGDQPPPAQPTVVLIPPIQMGDGSDLVDRLLENGVVRVGIRVWPDASFSPPAFRGFSNAATGGALNGFEVDIARLVAEGLGLELELVEAYPPVIASGDWRDEWDIAIASLAPFDRDTASTTEQSKNQIAFSQPYGYMPLGVLIPAGDNTIRTLTDLATKKVGVLEDSTYQRLLAPDGRSLTVEGQPLVAELPDDLQPVALSNLIEAIRQLGQPENDSPPEFEALFGPTPIFQEAIKSDLAVKLAPQAKIIGYQPMTIAVVPQDELTIDRLLLEINKILDRLQRRGTLAEVYLRWYEQDLSQIPGSEDAPD